MRWPWARRGLGGERIPWPVWRPVVAHPPLRRLGSVDRARLRRLAGGFLRHKAITPVQGLELDEGARVLIAAHACLPVLHLGRDYLDGWTEVVVYPGPFRVRRQRAAPGGVVHEEDRVLSGEAWEQGPLIVSWPDLLEDLQGHRDPGEVREGHHGEHHGAPELRDGHDVVVHEVAHKIDMLNGAANGMPPLHPGMVREDWTRALSQAYEDLYDKVERHHHTAIDPYAAENPAEFFAVLSELFFELPQRLYHTYPDVYRQLRLFYRQDPLQRQHADRHREYAS